MAVIYKHSHAPIPELPDELQGAYGAIVAGLLAKDPRDRFQTVGELLRALARVPGGHAS
jgi:hypothetical protein